MSLCPVDHKACQCSGTAADPCPAVEAMRAEIAALRRDSERWQWLLHAAGALSVFTSAWHNTHSAEEFTAHIDDAIQQSNT